MILPNDKAMLRADRLGLIDYLIKASQEHGATIRIICPLSEQNSLIVSRILEKSPSTKILNGNTTSAGMLIVDNAKFVRIELKIPQLKSLYNQLVLLSIQTVNEA